MNARRLVVVLVVVCVLQAVFIVALLRRTSASTTPPAAATGTPSATIKVVEKRVTNRFDWRAVENADYRSYIANLRAVGCPEETVRDIIIADVEKLFADRLKQASEPPPSELKYWLPEKGEGSALAYEVREAAQQQLDKEKRALIRELLGVDLNQERKKVAVESDVIEKRLRFLSAEKREQVALLIEQFGEREQTIRARMSTNGAGSAEDIAAMKQLHAERDAQLSNVLSADERKLYDYWMSNAGVTARFLLGGLDNPTQQDFEAIYKAKKRFEDEFDNVVNWSDPKVQQRYEQAADQLENEIRMQLGEQRYSEYKRAADHEYRQLFEVTQRLSLQKQTADQVYELKKAMERQTIQIVENPDLNDAQRQQRLTELRQAAGKQAREILGEEAFQLYRRNGTTGWFEAQ